MKHYWLPAVAQKARCSRELGLSWAKSLLAICASVDKTLARRYP